jgi:DNA polymerase-3 subunit delta'
MALIRAQIRGHERTRRSLEAAVTAGRLPSCLLFRGPEAVGKKLLALALAQDLLCEKGAPACGSCGSCLRVFKRQHEGLLLISTEETQLKLDDIQPVFDFLRLKLLGRARIVILDDAHKLNIQAANRLLKTLEEPPPHTHFFLITSQEASLPVTIRSRAQLVRFGPLGLEDQSALAEAPAWAYRASQGRMDLLTKLTQESGEERRFAFGLFKNFLSGARGYLFPQFAEFAKDKERTLEIFTFFEQFLRDLWVQDESRLIHPDLKPEYEGLKASSEDLERYWKEFDQTRKALEMNADRTLNLEALWFRLREEAHG